MDPAIDAEIAAIARDRESSATALAARAVGILRLADGRTTLEHIAAGLARAQPSMAALRTIPALALRASDPAAALERLAERLARAPSTIARLTADLILLGRSEKHVRVATCSRSALVEAALVELARRTRIVACCAEGRPALEGRALAVALARHAIAVELFSDAGLSSAVGGVDVLLVGADAISRTHFINKVGTAALCALAAHMGVPVYVLTGREKIVTQQLFEELVLKAGDPAELWQTAASGVEVVNPYFERISTESLSAVVTDGGVLTPAEVESAII